MAGYSRKILLGNGWVILNGAIYNSITMFYCQRVCGDENFSIKEWNEAMKYCDDNNIQGKERDFILNPELFPCEKQCFNCMAIVGQRRIKTKGLNNKD